MPDDAVARRLQRWPCWWPCCDAARPSAQTPTRSANLSTSGAQPPAARAPAYSQPCAELTWLVWPATALARSLCMVKCHYLPELQGSWGGSADGLVVGWSELPPVCDSGSQVPCGFSPVSSVTVKLNACTGHPGLQCGRRAQVRRSAAPSAPSAAGAPRAVAPAQPSHQTGPWARQPHVLPHRKLLHDVRAHPAHTPRSPGGLPEGSPEIAAQTRVPGMRG